MNMNPNYLGQFEQDIRVFNGMYHMPMIGKSPNGMQTRLKDFESILSEECKEINDIIVRLDIAPNEANDQTVVCVMLADLLGDIIVYCASEARRWNIPIDAVLKIIMESNFSKMGPAGPIYDERGKLLKGPNYWKPEEKIAALLASQSQSTGE